MTTKLLSLSHSLSLSLSPDADPEPALWLALKQCLVQNNGNAAAVTPHQVEKILLASNGGKQPFSAFQIRKGVAWLKHRATDADLIMSCKREHVAEHVFDHVVRFIRRNTDAEDHHMMNDLAHDLRESINDGIADAELGEGVFHGLLWNVDDLKKNMSMSKI